MSTKRRGPSRRRDSSGRFVKTGAGRSKTRVKHIVVRNPGEEFILGNPPRSKARLAAKAVGGFLGSSGIAAAAKNTIPALIGAMAAKLAQKRFGDKGDESAIWTGRDYLAGLLGALAVSLGAKALFRVSAQTSQRIMEGGFLIAAYKLATQKLAPMTETTRSWLADEGPYMGLGTADEGSWQGYGIGDLYDSADGQTYVLGSDGQWRPVDDSHRLPAASGLDMDSYIQDDAPYMSADEPYMGEMLSPPGRLGEDLVPPGRLGEDPYHEAYRA